jgi:hypothetical protein
MKLQPYFYDKQIERYLIQFANIFTGFQVKVGLGEKEHMIHIPVMYGSQDKVVQSIYSSNTQNKPIRLPMISTYMTGIELASDMYKGVGQEDRFAYLPSGGALPDDVRVVRRYMPIPYMLKVDVHSYCSNQYQQLQLLEQLMVLFDPTLVLQTTDAKFDWTKLTSVELTGIEMLETIPQGNEERTLISRMTFEFPIWITPPAKNDQDYVKRIFLRIGAVDEELSETDIIEFFNGQELDYKLVADAEEVFGKDE